MPYTIQTQDGIEINNIPDDVPQDSPQLKARVAKIRAQRDGGQQQAPQQAVQDPSPTVGGLRDIDEQFAETTTLQDQPNVTRETIRGTRTTPGAKVEDSEDFVFRGLSEEQKSAITARNTGNPCIRFSIRGAPRRLTKFHQRLGHTVPCQR